MKKPEWKKGNRKRGKGERNERIEVISAILMDDVNVICNLFYSGIWF